MNVLPARLPRRSVDHNPEIELIPHLNKPFIVANVSCKIIPIFKMGLKLLQLRRSEVNIYTCMCDRLCSGMYARPVASGRDDSFGISIISLFTGYTPVTRNPAGMFVIVRFHRHTARES